MIGVFDSGLGGIQTLKYLKNYFTDQEFLFVADNEHFPYGEKTQAQVKEYSVSGVNRLFNQGCDHVLIACNTAVAGLYNNREYHTHGGRVVGVTYAGIHEVIKSSCRHIGVLCTPATKRLDIYPTIYRLLRGEQTMEVVASEELAPMIESGNTDVKKRKNLIRNLLSQFSSDIDCLILGCTHYPVYIDEFRTLLPHCRIIDPGRSSIRAIQQQLGISCSSTKKLCGPDRVRFCCTGEVESIKRGIDLLRDEEYTGRIQKVSFSKNLLQNSP